MGMKKYVRQWMGAGDGLIRLLALNTVVFLILQFYILFCRFAGSSLPDKTGDDLFLASTFDAHRLMMRPWSIITHLFTHLSFSHFIFNMIFLYTAGKLFQQIVDSRKLVVVYLLGGITGFILYFVFYNAFPALDHSHEYILGASASAMAIVIAVAALRPSMKVQLLGAFKVQLVWIAVIFIAVDLWSLKRGKNIGGHIGHLGGALFGYLYAVQIKKGNTMASWFERGLEWLRKLFFPDTNTVVRQQNPRLKSDEEFNLEKRLRQKRMDEILDKIGRSGYDSLSREEREFLFKNSQK